MTDNNDTLLTTLVALRDEATKRLDTARLAVATATDAPKGTKGKRDAIARATGEQATAAEALLSITRKIREAMRSKAKAIVEASLATLDHRDADPILRQALVARKDERRQAAITLDGNPHGVHIRVSLDSYGLPDYIELHLLSNEAERREQIDRWLSQAKTPEALAKIQPYIDKPDENPLTHFGSSVTLSRGHGKNRNTYGVNGSTFSTHDDDEAARLRTLHDVAWHLRSALNDADLPKVEDLEQILEGNG